MNGRPLRPSERLRGRKQCGEEEKHEADRESRDGGFIDDAG